MPDPETLERMAEAAGHVVSERAAETLVSAMRHRNEDLVEGRIVHYVNPDLSHCQAAIIVRAWSSEKANLTVFPDWSNDRESGGLAWKTSVLRSLVKEPFTWHFAIECKKGSGMLGGATGA